MLVGLNTTANGTAQDSLQTEDMPSVVIRTERSVRRWTEKNSRWLAPSLAAVAITTQGMTHGYFYSRGEGDFYEHVDLHLVAYIQASSIWALTYLAGADPIEATGTSMVINVVFQGLINESVGRPLLDTEEKDCWDTVGGACVPHFYGRGRLVEAGVGLALMAAPTVVRHIRRRMRD